MTLRGSGLTNPGHLTRIGVHVRIKAFASLNAKAFLTALAVRKLVKEPITRFSAGENTWKNL